MSPVILVALPLVLAPALVLLQHRGALAAGLSAATSLVWAALSLAGPLAPAFEVLGRTMALSRLDRLALTFLGLEAAFLILTDWWGQQEVAFAPSALLMLGATTAALMASHLGVAALLLSLGAVIAVFTMARHDDAFTSAGPGEGVIAGSDRDRAQPASGYLALMVIATLLLVAAAWFSDVILQANVSIGARPVAILIATGLGVLLAVPPFHAWWVATVRHCPTALAAFLGTMLPTAGLLLLLEFIQANPWVTAGDSLARAFTAAGLLATAVGGGLAALADDWRRWLAYSAVAETGSMLAGLATMTVTGAVGALFLLLSHGLSLSLIVACRATWPHSDGSSPLPDLTGRQGEGKPMTSEAVTVEQEEVAPLSLPLAEVQPHSTEERTGLNRALVALGWAVGGLSLSGVPLTAGFVGRWLIYRPLFQYSPTLGAVLIVSSFCVLVGHVRIWHGNAIQADLVEMRGRSVFLGLLVAAIAVVSLVLGMVPGPILSPIGESLRLTFLSP